MNRLHTLPERTRWGQAIVVCEVNWLSSRFRIADSPRDAKTGEGIEIEFYTFLI
jgi:hypothetical protein